MDPYLSTRMKKNKGECFAKYAQSCEINPSREKILRKNWVEAKVVERCCWGLRKMLAFGEFNLGEIGQNTII